MVRWLCPLLTFPSPVAVPCPSSHARITPYPLQPLHLKLPYPPWELFNNSLCSLKALHVRRIPGLCLRDHSTVSSPQPWHSTNETNPVTATGTKHLAEPARDPSSTSLLSGLQLVCQLRLIFMLERSGMSLYPCLPTANLDVKSEYATANDQDHFPGFALTAVFPAVHRI
jgi:hypothetical protein